MRCKKGWKYFLNRWKNALQKRLEVFLKLLEKCGAKKVGSFFSNSWKMGCTKGWKIFFKQLEKYVAKKVGSFFFVRNARWWHLPNRHHFFLRQGRCCRSESCTSCWTLPYIFPVASAAPVETLKKNSSWWTLSYIFPVASAAPA